MHDQPHDAAGPQETEMDQMKIDLLKCLDSMALSLAEHDHEWSHEQRQAYESSVAQLTSDDCKATGSLA
jgi:hypothetical protein